MDAADKLRVTRVKVSVKENLNKYKAAVKGERQAERTQPEASNEKATVSNHKPAQKPQEKSKQAKER